MEPTKQAEQASPGDRFTWKKGDLIIHRSANPGKPLDMPQPAADKATDAEAA